MQNIEGVETDPKKVDIAKINNWYKCAVNEWGDFRRCARTAYKYYMGDQWNPMVVQQLRKSGRPALTINKIKPVIRTLSGYMRQNRKDQRVMPRRGGVQAVASIYTEVMKHIYDVSYADWYNSYAFLDGSICGKGWLSLDTDYTNDPISGDLIVGREDPFLILEDPFSVKYDLSDARFLFRMRWLDKQQMELMFPKAKDAIGDYTTLLGDAQGMGIETDDYTQEEAKEFTQVSKERYLVKECWYRTYEMRKLLVDTTSMTVTFADDYTDEAIEIIKAQAPHVTVMKRIMPRLHLKILLGTLELDHIDDPYGDCTKFPIVRFANEMIHAEKPLIRGEVKDIEQAQDEHNKRRSQSLHHLNSTANSGWVIERGALKTRELRKLEAMGSRAGIVVIAEDGRKQDIERQTPAPLSQGHVDLSNMADGDIKAISGVNADLLGNSTTKAESGVAMEARRRQGLINLEPVFDNFDFTSRVLGDTMLDIIRNTDIYSPEEIQALVGNDVKTIDGQQVTAGEVLAYMKTRKGNYSVKMSEQSNNPTIRLANFQTMLMAIREAGVPIPPDMIVEASDWGFKDDWMQRFQKAQQQVPPQGEPPIQPPLGGGAGNPNVNQAVADVTQGIG